MPRGRKKKRDVLNSHSDFQQLPRNREIFYVTHFFGRRYLRYFSVILINYKSEINLWVVSYLYE